MADGDLVCRLASKWNPLNWFGGGPVPVLGEEAEQLRIRQNSLLLDLPPEIRGIIFLEVTLSDHKSLRLVCRLTKYDIENDIGINARISGSDNTKTSWAHYTLVEYVYSLVSQEEQEISTKLEWLKTVLVRTLDVQRFSQLPLTTGQPLLRNPSCLRNLTLRLGEPLEGGIQSLDILNQCNGLKKFRIAYQAPKSFLDYRVPSLYVRWDDVQNYNKNLSKFFNDVLRSLSQKRLKHLSIITIRPGQSLDDYLAIEVLPLWRSWRPLDEHYIGMPPSPPDPPIDVPTTLEVLDIRVMQFRDVQMAYRLGTQIPMWKMLLDSQTQLTSLTVRVGYVYWRYFELALRKCNWSLKNLEIDVGNWHDPNSNPPPPDPDAWLIPELVHIQQADWFDWSVLFPQDCTLESLVIRMPKRSHATANRTKNFDLNFEKLKRLELHNLKLTQPNLEHILQQLPALKAVVLKEWYPVTDEHGDFPGYKQQFEETFECIRNTLQAQRLEDIKLFGKLVSGNIYRNFLAFQQTAIINPNYTVKYLRYAWDPEIYIDSHVIPTLHIYKNP